MGSNLTVFLLQAGDGDLQAVVVDGNLVPPQGVHFPVGTIRIDVRFGQNDTRERLQVGGDKQRVHAKGPEPINQEQSKPFDHAVIIHQQGRL